MTREEALFILKDYDRVGCNLIQANDEETTKFNNDSQTALAMAIQALEERKKGKWERHYIRPGVYADLWFHATCCGGISSFVTDYCPHCGARMIKEDEQDARK